MKVSAQSEYSCAGRFGHLLEPVIKPLGYDWKLGVGMVAAFAAGEVFVSTEGIVYATGGDTDAGTDNLQKAMQTARYDHGPRAGQPVWKIAGRSEPIDLVRAGHAGHERRRTRQMCVRETQISGGNALSQ